MPSLRDGAVCKDHSRGYDPFFHGSVPICIRSRTAHRNRFSPSALELQRASQNHHKLTIPPICAPGPGSGGKKRPKLSSRAFRSCHPTAGWTTASMSPGWTAKILSIRLKSITMPPRVAASAPEKLVPPAKAVTGIRIREQIFMIELTSDVLEGKTIRAGVWDGGAGDHGVLEWARHSSGLEVTFSAPTRVVNSFFAWKMLSWDISCWGADVSDRGAVE